MGPLRVFIADDHELVRYALRTVLEAEADMVVVGEGHDGESTLGGVEIHQPDVLVLDLRMPGIGGVETCRIIKDRFPAVSVLVLTSYDEDEELFGVISAGACGYLLKDSRPDRIVRAIRSVSEGEAVFDAAVASRVLGRDRHELSSSDALSEREMQVLECMAKGMSNKQIARELWIGETTVKTHVSNILHKLDQADRTQAVLAAVKSGLVRLT